MTPEQFAQLGQQGYNHIPVVRQLFADLETPLSCYVKVARGPYSYLLESANQGGEKWSRYSVVGLPSNYIIKIHGNEVSVFEHGELTEQFDCDDPLDYVEKLQARFSYPELEHLPVYTGGLVGYFGYDTIRYVEKKISDTAPPDTLETPDILLMVSNDVIIFDNVLGRVHLITHADPAVSGSFGEAQARLDEMQHRLRNEVPDDLRQPKKGPVLHEADFVSSYGEENFKNDVERIREYIVEGDVMQVVLAQRMSVSFESDPLNLYRALRSLNPSPYMYFLDLDEFQIVSSSPEILARLDHGEVTVRPLAGTRRRGSTEEEDLAMEQELLADPKEIAEHLMLIDLGRNDIGKVCQTGSVEVSEMMIVERYAHVMHIASNVRGQVKPDIGAVDVLRATLPVGTLSGAPKVRAMEIIDELEPEKRGIFGGAVGYLSWNGNMDTAIAIRTAIVRDNRLYIQAGAGVVADSIPRLEWKETINKARSIFQAAAMAESGLDLTGVTVENQRVFDHAEVRPVIGQGGD
ncbi:MAG: anthranilate synthase component I [Pseudomonadales bacterium]|jgi:anthranilate synthase component 1|nr:anthranilate synthase component I [Pseudomonadales bacterium]